MILILFTIVWFFVVLKWDVNSDYQRWVSKIPINHKRDLIVRGILLLPCYGFLLYFKMEQFKFWYFICQSIIIVGMLGSIWWEVFDGWFNVKRGFAWRFNGTIDKDDAFTDKVLYNLSSTLEGLLKWVLILTFLILYIRT